MSASSKYRQFLPALARLAVVVTGSLLAPGVVAVALEPDEVPDFDRDIRPILSNACFHCHGFDPTTREKEGFDLRLDVEEHAKEWAIVPGDVESSEVINRILLPEDDDLRMPPKNATQQLKPEEIELLKRWIAGGAPWAEHWAFIKPERPKDPELEQTDWPKNELDRHVLAKLEAEGLEPSPPASKERLIRRVSFDLTGLPPTIEDVDAFLADDSPGAYERLVDRLLDSPRYGEHMAVPWLTAARYADTNGYQGDGTRTMWPWRDWVVRSMNENLPFDQFTIEQLAGDLLAGPDGNGPTTDQLIATGFHRNHGINNEGGRNPEESRIEYVIDRVSTTGTVWMGMTLACCRCHDHKYDPVSQKEFYELSAFFNSIDERGNADAGGNAKPVMALPTSKDLTKIAGIRDEIRAAQQRIDQTPPPTDAQRAAWEAEATEWLARAEGGRLWMPLKGVALECENGVAFEQLDDASVLVTEMDSTVDDYVVTARLPEGVHHGIRIEALRDERFTGGFFSRGVKGGFSVSDLRVELAGERVLLANAEANKGDRRALLDESKYTEWKVQYPWNAPETPTWAARFTEPIASDGSTELVVRMRHQSRTGDAPIGRFRISVTEYAKPTIKSRLGFSKELVAALAKPAEERKPKEQKAIQKRSRQALTESGRDAVRELKDQLKQAEKSQLHTMVMRERKKPRDTHLLVGGLVSAPDKSEKLQPGVPGILPEMTSDGVASRLDLARWIVSPEHPLTARVTVNRYWQQFFGLGLVKTSEDFGVQGERPSNPELLDWLAVEFVQSGWDVKALHKTIVMSATYRQSSAATPELLEKDPYNRLLARGPRFRLSSHALRDQALAISGLLVNKIGGPGVRPYQPKGVWSDFSLGKIRYKRGKGDDLYRRSVYTFWRRPVGPTMLFDTAGRQMCAVRPNLTNTPLHALTMLNDTTYVEAARVFAERVLAEFPGEPERRIAAAFRVATSREATERELDVLTKMYDDLLAMFRADPEGAREFIAIGENPTDTEHDPAELAAYAGVMNAILNLDEVVTKG